MEESSLAQKLDDDVQKFISQLPRSEYKDGWTEGKWREEMEKHPMFMSKPVEEGQDMPPLAEALQQLKYDPDTNSPSELATSYKEDGNVNFKRKKYRWAVDSYTQGIEAKCNDPLLNAQLYTNRAAAQYHIGNYQKALGDAHKARNFKPDHIKAYVRGALCCLELRQFDDCISWCLDGLKIESKDEKLQEIKSNAEAKKKMADRDKRKASVEAAKKEKDYDLTMKVIKERGIKLASGKFTIYDIERFQPVSTSTFVHLDGNELVWPVLFIYPEYGTTDYIQYFYENTSFLCSLDSMFDPNALPDWDVEKKYTPDKIQIYFANGEYLIEVDKTMLLKDVLSHKRYTVQVGTPSFIITVAGSEFDKGFRKKYTIIS